MPLRTFNKTAEAKSCVYNDNKFSLNPLSENPDIRIKFSLPMCHLTKNYKISQRQLIEYIENEQVIESSLHFWLQEHASLVASASLYQMPHL